jgi:2-keto-4-pentenoate hydratase
MSGISHDIHKLAERLHDAEVNGIPIPAFSTEYPDLRVEHCHEIQLLNVGRRLREGERVVGYKVGLTNREAQKHFKVYQPDLGHLYDSMAVDHDGEIEFEKLIQPKIEGEVAFVLKKELRGPGLTIVDVMGAIDYATIALEVLDCRFEDWKLAHSDLVADNGASSRFVLSPQKHLLDGLDLSELGMALSKNGQVWSTGAGVAVMGNPVAAVVFLANELGRRERFLVAGEVVLSGAVTGMLRVEAGDSFTCEMGKLGSVSVRFSRGSLQ